MNVSKSKEASLHMESDDNIVLPSGYEVQVAVTACNLEAVKKCIPGMWDVNSYIGGYMYTPLGLLVASLADGKYVKGMAVADYLLGQGAAVDAIQGGQATALELLVGSHVLQDPKSHEYLFPLIRKLIDHGADPNRFDGSFGKGCLLRSAEGGNLIPALNDLLLACGAKVHILPGNYTDCTMLMYHYKPATHDAFVHILRSWVLSNPGPLISHTDVVGNNLLSTAVSNGVALEVIKLLVDLGFDIPTGQKASSIAIKSAQKSALSPALYDASKIDHFYKIAAFMSTLESPDLPESARLWVTLRQPWTELGRCSYGIVYKAWYRAIREDVAVTKHDGDKQGLKLLKNEISQLYACRCKHILTLYGCTHDEATDSLGMVTELYTGSLSTMLQKEGPPPAMQILNIVSQAGRALLYLHANSRCHCDVATRSFLLTPEGWVKLGNFSLAGKAGALRTTIAVRWSSPEMLTCVPHRRLACTANDVWAFGVFMWEVLSGGQEPYTSIEEPHEVKEHITQGGRLQKPEACPDDMWSELVLPCFEAEEHRPSVSELLEKIAALEDKALSDAADSDSLPTEERLARAVLREQLSGDTPISGCGSEGPAYDYWGYGDKDAGRGTGGPGLRGFEYVYEVYGDDIQGVPVFPYV
eukprot:TRINITY_DN2897_c0_g1_i1.p1 TRINITY_DN2897_c0_g1~~TRINITY_DN2897_c0_g1_i1.p1  ORF type:complete len:642 (+),score=132.22 TRINITY_DN2897_c0_g1_i1:69-1994(+)